MRVRVAVTKTDIAKGKKGSASSCPVALACRRAGLTGASVCVGDIGGDMWSATGIPDRVWEFAINFDKGEPVKPFVFRMSVPRERVRQQGRAR